MKVVGGIFRWVHPGHAVSAFPRDMRLERLNNPGAHKDRKVCYNGVRFMEAVVLW